MTSDVLVLICANFDDVILVFDGLLGFVEDYSQIKSVLLCDGPGQTGFDALGEILCGEVNPSGKTVDTYLYDLTTAPWWNNFGSFIYDNMSEFAVDASDPISFDVTVTNTGNSAGKEVIQVYANPPYTNGGIEKASTNLLVFDKTDLLEPGKSQTLSFTVNEEDLASYDDKVNGCYVLDAGDYIISINSDSHNVIDSFTYNVSATIVYGKNNGRSTDLTPAVNLFDDARGEATYLSRTDNFANLAEATATPSLTMPESQKDTFIWTYNYSMEQDMIVHAGFQTAAEEGVYGYMKHFAMNEQETNRWAMICTWSTEQAIREIYLKPFEICVKEGNAHAVMSSFNYIGGRWAGGHKQLLTGVLREEWGFQGFVETDYFAGAYDMNADQMLEAGGACCLSTFDIGTNFASDTTGATSLQYMRRACHDIMYTAVNSRAYATDVEVGMTGWMKTLIAVDVVVAIALVAVEVLLIKKYRKTSAAQ